MTRRTTRFFGGMLGVLAVSFVGLSGCGKAPPPEEDPAVDPAVEALAVEPLGALEPDLARETAILSEPWGTQGSQPAGQAVRTPLPEGALEATDAPNGPAEKAQTQLDMDDIQTSVEKSSFSGDPNR